MRSIFICNIHMDNCRYPTLLKGIAVKLFEQALSSEKTLKMICESDSADTVKDGVMKTIADTIAFLQ